MSNHVNPILKKLGLSESDKAVVFHADDIGVLQASVQAWSGLIEGSPMTAASVMTPCPWFRGAVAEFAQHENADVGVHMTLNSEWDTMRWRPLSTVDPASGLFDEEHYSPRTTAMVQENADPDAVAVELKAQMDRALEAGIDVTHIDSHMGTLFHPKFLEAYIRMGFAYQVPALILRSNQDSLIQRGYSEQVAAQIEGALKFVEERGMPMFDSIVMLPLREAQAVSDRTQVAKEFLENMKPGLHYFIFHPAVAGPEIKAVAPDWEARHGDYELFKSEDWKSIVADSGVTSVSCRQLRDVFRKTLAK